MIKRLLMAALCAGAVAACDKPAEQAAALDQVKTQQGLVAAAQTSIDGVRAFKGVPFAKPPVGDLRWKAPEEPVAWEGVRNGDAYGAICIQPRAQLPAAQPGVTDVTPYFVPVADPMSEDCLYLNVWTPAKKADEKLPVVVFIPGGGFTSGSGTTPMADGAGLAKEGVVVASINYRVGPFGFLAHPALSAESGGGSGNYGLMDQVAALKWLQKNVAAFGGDPSRVTIYGSSAGSMAVSALTASPQAKGLFHRVIAQSGTAFGGRLLNTLAKGEEAGAKYFDALGVKTLAEARALSADALMKVPATGTGVVIGDAVLPQTAADAYAAGQQNDVPVIVGWNANEDTILAGGKVMGGGSADGFRAAVAKEYGPLASRVLQDYPAGGPEQVVESSSHLFSDSAFGAGTLTWAKTQATRGKAPLYVYHFTHHLPDVPNTIQFGRPLPQLKAAHGVTGWYVWDYVSQLKDWPWTDTDRMLAKAFQGYYVNFAKTGNPNGEGLPRWDAVTDANAPQVLLMGEAVAMAPFPRAAGMTAINEATAAKAAAPTLAVTGPTP